MVAAPCDDTRGGRPILFLSGTLLNVATVIVGTTVGLLLGSRLPQRVHDSLTTGLGLFVAVLAVAMATSVFTDPARLAEDELAILGGVLAGVALGELLRLHDRLDAVGAWFQDRLSGRGPFRDRNGTRAAGGGSSIAQAFVAASLVFCVGPLTILGSLDNGLRGDATLLSVKSLLDGVASIAFAAALGPGVYLSALTVLVVQGGIAAGAFLVRDALDARTILAITSAGGVILLGTSLLLLDIKAVRVANFLPALIFAPLFLALGDLLRGVA